jgi:uncharacterized metal-binding protein
MFWPPFKHTISHLAVVVVVVVTVLVVAVLVVVFCVVVAAVVVVVFTAHSLTVTTCSVMLAKVNPSSPNWSYSLPFQAVRLLASPTLSVSISE